MPWPLRLPPGAAAAATALVPGSSGQGDAGRPAPAEKQRPWRDDEREELLAAWSRQLVHLYTSERDAPQQPAKMQQLEQRLKSAAVARSRASVA